MPDIATPTTDTVHNMDLDVANAATLTTTEFPGKCASDINVPKKPVPGSPLWYEIRKENHKRVERKRRETINQAMDDLGAVVPGNEKNKSRILGRAVEYIKALMEENHGLRKQAEQYWEANQQQLAEIVSLKAQLETHEQQLQGDTTINNNNSSSSSSQQRQQQHHQPEDHQTQPQQQLPPLEIIKHEPDNSQKADLSSTPPSTTSS